MWASLNCLHFLIYIRFQTHFALLYFKCGFVTFLRSMYLPSWARHLTTCMRSGFASQNPRVEYHHICFCHTFCKTFVLFKAFVYICFSICVFLWLTGVAKIAPTLRASKRRIHTNVKRHALKFLLGLGVSRLYTYLLCILQLHKR